MRIGWVGGMGRSEQLFTEIVERTGNSFEFHEGDVRGRGANELERLVNRCDTIVIVTDLNSHGGVLTAKDYVRKRGRVPVLVRKSSVSSLKRVLRDLGCMV
jgi:hypothetical protein